MSKELETFPDFYRTADALFRLFIFCQICPLKSFQPLSPRYHLTLSFLGLQQLLPEPFLCLRADAFYAKCPILNGITPNCSYNLTLIRGWNLNLSMKSLPNLFLTYHPRGLKRNDSGFVHLIYIASSSQCLAFYTIVGFYIIFFGRL